MQLALHGHTGLHWSSWLLAQETGNGNRASACKESSCCSQDTRLAGTSGMQTALVWSLNSGSNLLQHTQGMPLTVISICAATLGALTMAEGSPSTSP